MRIRGASWPLLLLLTLPLRAEDGVGEADPPGARAVAGSGWQVSDPPGFTLLPFEEGTLYALAWKKEWDEKTRDKTHVFKRKHAEHIRAFYDPNLPWEPGAPLPATCEPGHAPRKHPIEGRHYGRPTLSYFCDDGNRERSDTHIYYVVIPKPPEEGVSVGWARVALTYHHEWDHPPLPVKAKKTPSLETFRWMQGTLSPIQGELPTRIASGR